MKPSARLLKFSISLIGALPVWLRSVLGRALGNLYWLFPTAAKKIARLHMDLHIPEEGGSRNLRRMFSHFGQSALESLNVNAMVKNPDHYVVCHDRDVFERVISAGRPTVVLTAHTANWDLLAAWLVKIGIRLSTVGTPMRNPTWHEALSAIREGYGVTTLWRTGIAGTRKIVHAFKDNGLIGTLNDQDTRVKSIQIPFFGKPARTPIGLVTLGKRYDARFIWMLMAKTNFNRYALWAGELDADLTAQEIAAAFNAQLEAHIRRFPEQWVWFHKRWARQAGQPTLRTGDYIQHLKEELEKKDADR